MSTYKPTESVEISLLDNSKWPQPALQVDDEDYVHQEMTIYRVARFDPDVDTSNKDHLSGIILQRMLVEYYMDRKDALNSAIQWCMIALKIELGAKGGCVEFYGPAKGTPTNDYVDREIVYVQKAPRIIMYLVDTVLLKVGDRMPSREIRPAGYKS